MLEIERWKGGAELAYSFIYENAFESILRHSAPIHDEFMVPANVAVVAGQIGSMHNVPGSPYHMLFRHLNAGELRRLLGKGWTISSHTMTHQDVESHLYRELVGSRAAIEEAVSADVSVLVLPHEVENLVTVGAYAGQNAYRAVFTYLDHLNYATDDLLCLGRVPLVEEGPPPRRRQFDPFDRLALAREQGAWVVDSTQAASPDLIRPDLEISTRSLARRFDKVRQMGAGRVWCAAPEEVVDYVLTQRATKIVPGQGGPDGNEYVLSVTGLDPGVKRRCLSFRVTNLREGPPGRRPVYNLMERREIPPSEVLPEGVRFDVEVMDCLRIRVPDA